MEHFNPDDSFESGFIAGWFLANGITGQPTLMQVQDAISAFARFAAGLGRKLASPTREVIDAALPHGAFERVAD
jgi:hypothetical protein